ncbi:MAG: hypothetical protein ACKO9Z_00795 [Planctomycetota bacterium]
MEDAKTFTETGLSFQATCFMYLFALCLGSMTLYELIPFLIRVASMALGRG